MVDKFSLKSRVTGELHLKQYSSVRLAMKGEKRKQPMQNTFVIF